ncbi:ACP phosphodiesterase [Spirochaeta dissipatitropha]
MHLLAHALLADISLTPGSSSGDAALYITGSVMADFFSGQNLQDYPLAVRRAILQHREIDDFTDRHPVFQRSRGLIASAGAPHLTSGILADIFWGHILAARWAELAEPLCGLPLTGFSSRVYKCFEATEDWHSPGFARAVQWISRNKFLERIAVRDGIEQSLHGLSRRLRGAEKLPESMKILDRNIDRFGADLSEFWPEAVELASRCCLFDLAIES